MTNEQITQLVADMQTRLDTCSQAGQAYRLKWHEVKVVIEAMQTLQQRLAEANDVNNDVVEREAAVCPEDVGFDEYIRSLQTKLAQVEQKRDSARKFVTRLTLEKQKAEQKLSDAIQLCKDKAAEWEKKREKQALAEPYAYWNGHKDAADELATELEKL